MTTSTAILAVIALVLGVLYMMRRKARLKAED
jgi:hypothetical protein